MSDKAQFSKKINARVRRKSSKAIAVICLFIYTRGKLKNHFRTIYNQFIWLMRHFSQY